jgi:hypothetical protein
MIQNPLAYSVAHAQITEKTGGSTENAVFAQKTGKSFSG